MAHILEGHYEEVDYAGQWPSTTEHKVKSYTKVTTRTWPPDSFFQEAEAKRAERLREEAELEALQREVQRRKEALIAFDRATSAAAAAPKYVSPPIPRVSTPPRLTTKVVVKKWPPDSWFEDERKKAAKPKQYPQPAQSSNTQQQYSPGHSARSDQPYGSQGAYNTQLGLEHRPVPIDPNTRMYNPHGFWPYSQGQPRVQPKTLAMERLREEMPALEAARLEALAAQANPYAANQYQAQPQYDEPYQHEQHHHQHAPQYPPPQEVHRSVRQDSYPVQAQQQQHLHAQHQHGTIHAHHEEHHHAPAMQGQPAYAQEQEELLELGDHFQCLGCGCHIRPSEVVYRPRTVPCLPPDVAHEPIPLEKPDGRQVVLKAPPKRPSVQLPRMPSLQLPPEPPREELAIKDVEPFDFDKARREGLEKAAKEKEEEYGIKTVENFDFAAAQAKPQAPAHQPPPQAGDDRVKAVEDFDFDAARQQTPAAPPPQPEAPRNPTLAAMRARVQAASQVRYEDGS
jgi:hypothetical protein